MSRRITILVVAAALFLFHSSSVGFSLGTTRAEGMGGCMRLSGQSASEAIVAPTHDLSNDKSSFDCWYRRQWEMKEFDQYYLAGTLRRGAFDIGLGLGQFGSNDLYRELTGRVVVAYAVGRFTVGASWSGLMIDFGGHYDRLSAATLGFSASARTKKLQLAIAADNLTEPSLDDNSPDLPPVYSLFGEWNTSHTYCFVGRAAVQSEQPPQFGIGQIIAVSNRAELFWGIATAPTKYGGGLAVKVLGKEFTYSASYHPTLGLSHSVALTIGFASKPAIP